MAELGFNEKVAALASNASTVTKFEHTTDLTAAQVQALSDALCGNTVCKSVVIANTGIDSVGMAHLLTAIEKNNTLEELDIGYNKLKGADIIKLGEALAKNSHLLEVKIHRQQEEMGPIAEESLVQLYKTNTTLVRLYATLHNRKYNGDNTRGEVRNKEIQRRKQAGRDWIDLDPARQEEYKAQQAALRKQQEEEAAKANAPISSKVPSTGGPYSLKQLTCAKEFQPDDVDYSKRETYLSDEEFSSVFGCGKDDFAKLPAWKRTQKKKEKKLN